MKSDNPKPEYVRSFSVMTYIDTDAVCGFVSRCPWIQHYALAYHDKDVWTADDEKKNPKHVAGTPKEPHTHIILHTYSAKTVSAIIKNFDRFSREYYKDGTPQNTLCEIPSDVATLWRYLIHKDDPDKYQYPITIRKSDSLDYWNKYEKTDGMTDSTQNFGLAMFYDLANGATTKEMIERYGKEYIYHARHFKEVVSDHYNDCTRSARLSCDSYVDQYMLVTTATILRNQLSPKEYSTEFLQMFETALLQALNNASLLDEYFVYVSKSEN